MNNVETYANIPVIINKGAAWFSSIGTEKSKGTKVFALAGKIKNVGLVEVPMGTTLREVIFDIGGGIENGKKFKSVQTGGPSGGCLTEKHLDIPIDYDNLIVGWGSTYGVLKEYVEQHNPGKTAYLYIKQPFPLAPSLKSYFDQATQIIDVESNGTAQFASLLKLELDVSVTHKLLKFNGVPLSIEDVVDYMKEVL